MAAVAVVLLPAHAACASCLPDDRPLPVKVAEAEIVFVGTVLTVTKAGRTARMQVEDIWRGAELGEQVVVHGGPGGASSTSVDRYWEPGKRYLVFPRRDDGRLTDTACSPTQLWEPQLVAFRPDESYPLEPQPGRVITTAQPTAWLFISVAVIVMLVLGIGWLVSRQPRRPPLGG